MARLPAYPGAPAVPPLAVSVVHSSGLGGIASAYCWRHIWRHREKDGRHGLGTRHAARPCMWHAELCRHALLQRNLLCNRHPGDDDEGALCAPSSAGSVCTLERRQ
eukprot:366316-Chlamydomonas_euryale.AAC.2